MCNCLLIFFNFQLPRKRPEYRLNRSHSEFLTRLKYYYSSIDAYEESILNQLKSKFEVIPVTMDDEQRKMYEDSVIGGLDVDCADISNISHDGNNRVNIVNNVHLRADIIRTKPINLFDYAHCEKVRTTVIQ